MPFFRFVEHFATCYLAQECGPTSQFLPQLYRHMFHKYPSRILDIHTLGGLTKCPYHINRNAKKSASSDEALQHEILDKERRRHLNSQNSLLDADVVISCYLCFHLSPPQTWFLTSSSYLSDS